MVSSIYSIFENKKFNESALHLFRYQAKENPVYKEYLHHLSIDSAQVTAIEQIPFLPIDFFKTHSVLSGKGKAEKLFLSSGTTSNSRSQHAVTDIELYQRNAAGCFGFFYGDSTDYSVLALLPPYKDNMNSSLLYMVNDWIFNSKHKESGFYWKQEKKLIDTLLLNLQNKKKTLLIGLSYGFLDLIEKVASSPFINFPKENLIVMETGGMKGKRKEMIREELHNVLCTYFDISSVHSEYGMTELLSQAYSKGNGIFYCPPTMQVLIRDKNDPFSFCNHPESGCINIIDLANVNSCAFIATMDLGRKFPDGSFEVLGRTDNSDLRGCNLML